MLQRARRFADAVPRELGIRAVVVFGSVARGDFSDSSDIDVLLVADHLPARALDRDAAVGIPPARVAFVAWTPDEWRRQRDRGNPIAHEAATVGVVLRGGPDAVSERSA